MITTWISRWRTQGAGQFVRKRIAPVNVMVTRWRGRLQPFISQAIRRWHGLQPRERQQILLMLGVLIAAVLWLLFTRPALNALRYWENEMPRLRSQAVALQEVLADLGTPFISSDTSTQSVAERVKESLDQGGFAGTYQVLDSGSMIVVAIEQPVASTPWLTWLMNAPVALGLNVTQVVLERDRGDAVAQVSQMTARVTLVEQQKQRRSGTS